MRHAFWLALLPGLLFASGDQARQADAPGVAAPATPAATVTAPPPPPIPADLACKEALDALALERQTFVESFDWGQAGDPDELARRYSRTMDDFVRRELEIKRDWYEATGQTDLLAGVEASLDRLTQPQRLLPEIEQERGTPIAPEVTP
ncbi:MAG: hypothetical protein Q8O14_02055 [bacterium]|jgi:hypothetical protein|nr:hypothetical protein [bacterium]